MSNHKTAVTRHIPCTECPTTTHANESRSVAPPTHFWSRGRFPDWFSPYARTYVRLPHASVETKWAVVPLALHTPTTDSNYTGSRNTPMEQTARTTRLNSSSTSAPDLSRRCFTQQTVIVYLQTDHVNKRRAYMPT